MSQWREGRLGDFLEFKRGYDLPSREREPGRFPIVSSSGVSGSHTHAKVSGPGVITGRYGTIGSVFFVAEDFWPLNTTLYVRDFKGNDPRFVSYLLMTIDFTAYVDKAAVPGVNRNHVHAERVRLPTPPVQRAIAGLLGTLDDKIELNRRMNETLEATFATVLAAGSPGAASTFGEIADNVRDIVQPGEVDADTPYVALEHMPRHSIALAEWGTADSATSAKSRFRRADILFGKLRPYFHKVGMAPGDGICSTDILVLRPKRPELRSLILAIASSDSFVAHANATSTGTKMPRASWRDLAQFEITLPLPDALARLSERTQPLLRRIGANIDESRTLAALRDALLPKLISGELRIRDVDRAAEQAT